MARLKELDGLRGVAASLVMLGHCVGPSAGYLPKPIAVLFDGTVGVTIIFVLSGYVITSLLKAELDRSGSISLRSFYLKRALRIVPASYSYLLVVSILAAAGYLSISASQLVIGFAHLWNYQALILPADQHLQQGTFVIGHFWSLAVQEQFYWLWPFALLIFKRQITVLLLVLIGTLPLIRIAHYVLIPGLREQLSLMFHTGVDPIAVGALLAVQRHRVAAVVSKLSSSWLTTVFVALFVAVPVAHYVAEGKWLITYGKTMDAGLAGLFIMILIERPAFWASHVLRTQPFQYIGMISFSLYLWQQAFCYHDSIFSLPPLLAVTVSIVAGSISYFVIERPCQRLRAKLLSPDFTAPSRAISRIERHS